MPALFGTGRRHGVATLSVVALLVVLCSYGAQLAQGFAYVPMISTFAKPEKSGVKATSRLLCQEGGGYLATEATAALHQSVVQTVLAAGATTSWYAYLGASTRGNPVANCPPSLDEQATSPTTGQSNGCFWRWNQGRWTETEDAPSSLINVSNAGVTFFIGNYFSTAGISGTHGSQGGFVDFFNSSETPNSLNRPSAMHGQDLLAVGNSDSATWSDNKATGGYSYAGFSFSPFFNGSRFSATAQSASRTNFWAVCQAQAPSRQMYERADTSSDLAYLWWVIFLVVVGVVGLVSFILVAVCQDNEDMDEPPQDAPSWAQDESRRTSRSKSFTSSRSFSQRDYDDTEDDERSMSSRSQSMGSRRSSMGSRRSSMGSRSHGDGASTQKSQSMGGQGGSMYQAGMQPQMGSGYAANPAYAADPAYAANPAYAQGAMYYPGAGGQAYGDAQAQNAGWM